MADDPNAPMPDMGSLLDMAMGLQQQMAEAQARAAETVVEGHAGGGVVRIAVTGGMQFQSVTIDPEAVDPDDVEMLQDLILAALHDAVARVDELTREANPLAGMDLGNLDLGGLSGLFGGEDDDDLEVLEAAEVEPDADDDDD